MSTSSSAVATCGHVHASQCVHSAQCTAHSIDSTTDEPLQFVKKEACFPPVAVNQKINQERMKKIRILYLLPHSTKIVCELHVEDLKANPIFEALSYCWGSPKEPVSIEVNGYEFRVTQSLNAALRNLIPGPDSNGPRKLWIDAICINQGHSKCALDERKLQVEIMGDIYSSACSVTAYLGEPFESLDQAMRYLESSAGNPAMHFDPKVSPYNQSGGDSTLKKLNLALVKFFGYSWWARMWIVQEYSLARSLYFQVGNSRFAADMCARAVRHLFNHRDAGCCDRRSFLLHGQLNEEGRRMQDVWTSFSKLQILENTGRLDDILDGLGRFSSREASNSRDKIFALKSLCTEEVQQSNLIEINYKSPERVFVDFTHRWIQHPANLNLKILSYLGMPTERRPTDMQEDLPSFAVNWGNSPRQSDLASWHRRVNAQARLFQACGETRASWRIRSADSVTANGLLFDTVKAVIDGFNGDFYDPDLLSGWLDSTRALLRDMVYPNAPEAMMRTACSDLEYRDGDFHRISDDHFVLLDHWWREVLRLYSINQVRPPGTAVRWPTNWGFNTETILSIRESISVSALGRDIFVTDKGYLGLAPKLCRPGDKVAVMARGFVPIILRDVEFEGRDDQSLNPEDTADGPYEVIGDAYVHGIMDGEAFTMCERREDQLDELILV